MELTIKINLDSKTHSKYHNVEASLWLYYLSQHLDKNFDDEKLEKILNEKNFIYSQGKNKKKIGFYNFSFFLDILIVSYNHPVKVDDSL